MLAEQLEQKEENLQKNRENLGSVIVLLGSLKTHLEKKNRHLRLQRSVTVIVSMCHKKVALFSVYHHFTGYVFYSQPFLSMLIDVKFIHGYW